MDWKRFFFLLFLNWFLMQRTSSLWGQSWKGKNYITEGTMQCIVTTLVAAQQSMTTILILFIHVQEIDELNP
jgi:hypothetical protein